jgi:hypothetical protein
MPLTKSVIILIVNLVINHCGRLIVIYCILQYMYNCHIEYYIGIISGAH